ncbi:Regulator of spindle pole body duplication [Klebsormidium nitens]|uniref:separase n=1 Tax=Klebsormidium nitens TaxID=105231 RepID=A0A1Y1HWP3_KLENI|nr:Regulator of spindle pole body duplication [Klebsormidium nitens]|eukprot:GAQ80926.1 Regulator of spindle pole body duplication [Klebsormidium nitens]
MLIKARAWHVKKVGLLNLRAAASGGPGRESVESLVKVKVVELQSPGQEEAAEMVTLVVGSILNLLICLLETAPMSMTALEELRPAIDILGLWISKLDDATAAKHRDSLFRCLYKAACQLLQMVTSPIGLACHYCSLALHACSQSSSNTRYLQVAQKLSRSLTERDPNKGLAFYQDCLQSISVGTQGSSSSDILALVASYTQACIDHASEEAGCHMMYNLSLTHQITGLHILPLLLNLEPDQLLKLSKGNQKRSAKPCLQSYLSSVQKAMSAVDSTLNDLLQLEKRRVEKEAFSEAEAILLSLVPVLELLRKAASRHVENTWQAWVASEGSERHGKGSAAGVEAVQGAVEEGLLLWVTSLDVFCSLRKKSKLSGDAFTKLLTSLPSVLSTRMRLCLAKDEEKVLTELQLASKWTQKLSELGVGRELKGLSSGMYNLGVQLFNQHRYDLAKHPLSVASLASWERFDTAAAPVRPSDQSLSYPSTILEQHSPSDVIQDACSKTASHADCIRREGDAEAAADALVPGFRGLCRIAGALPGAALQILVKQLDKIQALDPSFFVHNHVYQKILEEDRQLASSSHCGLIFEEILAGLQSEETATFAPAVSSLLNLMLTSIYAESSHPIRRARLLMEHARLTAADDEATCTRNLKDAIKLQASRIWTFAEITYSLATVLSDSRKAGKDGGLLASLRDECALARCRLLLLKHTDAPQDLQPAVRDAFQLWTSLLERKDVTEGCFLSPTASQSCLLQVADLLAVKGLSSLQQQAIQLVTRIAHAVSPSTPLPHHCASLLAHSRLSHLLCCNPLPSPASLSDEGDRGKTHSFWEKSAALCPGSLLEATVKSRAGCACTESPSTSERDDVSASAEQELRAAIAQSASAGRRSATELVKQSGLLQALAERLLREGRRDEALCEATEALRIRFGLFGHTFGAGRETEGDSHAEGEEKQDSGRSVTLTPTVAAARVGWPSLFSRKETSGKISGLHNSWRVVGDYLESLFFVGTLSESAGMVDDAEQNFREGRRIAEAAGAAHVCAAFLSSMGEVKRKKGKWDAASEAFERAGEFLREAPIDCEGCRVLALARLERRKGDLVRRRPGSASEAGKEQSGAREHYERAAKMLHGVVGSEPGSGRREKQHLVERAGLSKGLGATAELEEGSMEGVKRNLMWAMSEAEPSKELVVPVKRKPGRKAPANPERTPLAEAPTNHKTGRPGRKKAAVEVVTILSSDEEASCVTRLETANPAGKRKGPVRGRASKIAQESSASELESEASSTSVANSRAPVTRKQPRGRKPRNAATGSDAASESSPPAKRVPALPDLDKRQEKLRRVVLLEKDSVLPALRGSRLGKIPVGAAELDELQAGVGRIALNDAGGERMERGSDAGLEPWLPAAREELARVLVQQGKCCSSPEQARTLFLRGLALVRHCPAAFSSSLELSPPAHHPLTEAALLYHLSLLALSSSSPPSAAQHSSPLEMLTRAYDFSTSAPLLFRKIALQLAALHSTPLGDGCECHVSADARIAAYYHQAAVGASSMQQHRAILDTKLAALSRTSDTEDKQAKAESGDLLREVRKEVSAPKLCVGHWPDTLKADFHNRILDSLPPNSAVCCISVVRPPSFSGAPSDFPTADDERSSDGDPSLLITRMTSDKSRKPVSVRLPIPVCMSERGASAEPEVLRAGHESAYDELSDDESTGDVSVTGETTLRSALEEVLECFAEILEESRRSTAGQVDTSAQKKRWWRWRLTLDKNLGGLLQTMEDTWLGPWRCLLVGEPANPAASAALVAAARDLKKRMDAAKQGRAEWANPTKSGPCVDLELVRLLLQGAHSLPDGALESAVAELLGWSPEVAESAAELREESGRNRTPRGRGGADEASDSGSENESGEEDGPEGLELRQAKLVVRLADEMRRVAIEADVSDGDGDVSTAKGGKGSRKPSRGKKTRGDEDAKGRSGERLPVVLVLDCDLQALPWESLPVLRSSRVYRAPSVASIRALVARSRHQSLLATATTEERARFSVDASNAFYLLNPSGDLEATQASFEQWFRSQKGWQGLVNRLPSVEQLLTALQEHDLFVYLGHGSGEQFLPPRSLRRLRQCATALLMGCSSGRLTLRGDYEPMGAVLSYLMAASPAVVANLWDVTDGDIDRFSKTVLQRWLQPRSGDGSDSENEQGGSRAKWRAEFELPPREECIGSAVADGRAACILPFLIGAAPVCYGVPTGVTMRE